MLNLKTKKIKDFVFAINKEKNCRALTPAEMKNLKGGYIYPTGCYCFCWDEVAIGEWDSDSCEILNKPFEHPWCSRSDSGKAFCQKNIGNSNMLCFHF